MVSPIPIDPVDPPADANEAERLLYEGRCPHCEQIANVALDEEGEAVTCSYCQARFEGLEVDREAYQLRGDRPRAVLAWLRDGLPDRVPAGKGPPPVRVPPPRTPIPE